MKLFAGLDVGGKLTAVCIVDEAGKTVWQGMVDTHPALKRCPGKLAAHRRPPDDNAGR